MYFVHYFSSLMWLISPSNLIPKENYPKKGHYQYMKLTSLLLQDVIAIKKASSQVVLY